LLAAFASEADEVEVSGQSLRKENRCFHPRSTQDRGRTLSGRRHNRKFIVDAGSAAAGAAVVTDSLLSRRRHPCT